MPKLKKFMIVYAGVFSLIWVGYGIYAVATQQPSGGTVLGFGLGFSVVVCLASWLAYWLMGHYGRIDRMAKDILANPAKHRKLVNKR
ncbi:hypothetical protein JNUCC1_01532 [Lentibacillus sp. JNUCC-1]|uniref:hypothetical protein n=1 Tax=Lentibacillus sp. JNUCC-1 TaxID=2654513 RepID=UPI0012E74BCC|nr:hypothetical protein [Lentibacillus sp. JNUCC-1]MUV37726.1 hypothetical protein [Lentibacillus sp. JNUCC-1]